MEKYKIKKRVVTCGYPSLDRVLRLDDPMQTGKTSIITNHDNDVFSYGGCGVNIAYILACLGVNAGTCLVGGSDFTSSGYRAFLEDAGVNLDGVTVNPSLPTSKSYLLEDSNGNHVTLFYPGAMEGAAGQFPEQAVEGADYAVLAVGDKAYNDRFRKAVQSRNIPLIFSMKFDVHAFPREELAGIIRDSSYIFMNEGEYTSVQAFLEYGLKDFFKGACRCMIVTCGKKGSEVIFPRGKILERHKIGICPVSKPVDSLGVGDAFVAGFVYGLVHGLPLADCGWAGSAAASFVLEGRGCLSSVPDETELNKRIKDNSGVIYE